MKNVVAAKSRYCYLCKNTTLLLWAYNNSPGLLSNAFLEDMELVEGFPKQLRETCKSWLNEMESFGCTQCPINLESLTFQEFSSYITTRKNRKNSSRYLSKSSYDAIRSALAHLYRCTGLKPSDEMEKKSNNSWGG